MNATLRAAIHLGIDYDTNVRFEKNYLWKTTGQLFRETEKLSSDQTETAGIRLNNFQDSKGGYRQAYCTVELINTPLPRSTSFPTRCCVWEEWETIPINLGRTRLSGIQ